MCPFSDIETFQMLVVYFQVINVHVDSFISDLNVSELPILEDMQDNWQSVAVYNLWVSFFVT